MLPPRPVANPTRWQVNVRQVEVDVWWMATCAARRVWFAWSPNVDPEAVPVEPQDLFSLRSARIETLEEQTGASSVGIIVKERGEAKWACTQLDQGI